MKNVNITDEQLIAFADERCSQSEQKQIEQALEQDSILQDRLRDISGISTNVLSKAFDQALTQAPIARLEKFLDEKAQSITPRRQHRIGKSAIAASLAAALFFGGIAGYNFSNQNQPKGEITNWRESVAVYQMLYTTNTLANVATNASQTNAMRTRLTKLSGLKIKIFDLENLGISFKRGQILDFKGSKLVQLAYLSDTGKPVAICFVNQRENDHSVKSEKRHGLNVVHWVKSGVPAMVIGDLPKQKLEQISKAVLGQQN